MFESMRRHATTILVAMVTAAVTAGGPALAAAVAQAVNADKVDGKHAVASGTSVANRKGKLVATSGKTGRLPNNIISKAPNADKLDGVNSTGFLRAGAKAADADQLDGKDSTAFLGAAGKATDADKLDGKDSTAFLGAAAKATDADLLDGVNSSGYARTVLQPGETLTGGYAAWGSQGYLGDFVTFSTPLAERVLWTETHFLASGAPTTAQCPGTGQAAAGVLCVYEVTGLSRSLGAIFSTEHNSLGTSKDGFTIYFFSSASAGNPSYSYGTWAVKAPEAVSAAPSMSRMADDTSDSPPRAP